MENRPYGMICSITHACNVLEPRWTIPILTEMWGGATRFNEIRRGVGNISPALLSRRLKELEAKGLIERQKDKATGAVDYFRTPKAIALEPALDALATWALQNLNAEEVLGNVDAGTLMWNMRRVIDADRFPPKRTVLRFHFSDDGLDHDTYIAIVHPGHPTEICTGQSGRDIDLYIETSVASLTALAIGRASVAAEIDAGRLFVTGEARLARTMQDWLKPSYYADKVSEIRMMGGALSGCPAVADDALETA